MAKLIITVSKEDSSIPWFDITPDNIHTEFTDDEIILLTESKTVLDSLLGYQNTQIVIVDSHTRKRIMSFDTLQNATAAKELIENPITNSPLYFRKQILDAKYQSMNMNATVTYTVE